MKLESSQVSKPFGTVLSWLEGNGIFFNSPESGVVFFHIELENVTVRLLCRQLDSGRLGVVVFFPVKACLVRRPMVGEYLLRLNHGLEKPVFQFDHEDGEVRIVVEMSLAPNCGEQEFQDSLFSFLFFADKVFPYLNSVITGAMNPEFAADQSAAAVQSL
jgi:hypothetical protein